MAILRATVVLNKKSGIPRDASRNVWHFAADDNDNTTLTALGDGLISFYQGLSGWLSPSVANAAGAHRIEFAEVGFDSVSPITAIRSFATTGVSTTNVPLPNEVAVCLSFRASVTGVAEESGNTRPRSRRRGRVFLGPLNTAAQSAEATTYEPQVAATLREDLLDLYDTSHNIWDNDPSGIRHAVLSRTDGVLRLVELVSVDNEFDTQRRRGQKPSLRMERSVTAIAQTGRTGTDVALAS